MDLSHLPHACGVYLMRDAAGDIIYIGKAVDLAKRVSQYFNPSKTDLKNSALTPLIRAIDYIPCASEREALLLERKLIRDKQPFFNSMWKDDKSYPYVKLTLGEDFPRLLMTRRKTKDKSAYFGPYPKAASIKSLLRYLWRSRLFPLRPCRWEFSLEKPLAERKIHSCLYYHTGQCPAPCAGKISRADYRAVAARALLFFRGAYGALREKIEEEMQRASSELEYERAAALRNNLSAIAQMGERVRLKALSAEDIAAPLLESQAVTDLKDALGLAKTPFHIECFDISHFQGRFTVASMVCFTGGRPNKNHYRRFKIRETTGINDFKSMAEAVFRRYRRRAREDLPDLILIDGGKGQLGAATESLDKLGLDIPVASLAKRLEEIFVPGRSRSILLERRRPALRMFQHLRD
ncbi:MAG: excinuclease ABC subunit UvrC, partial [Elusimicrobia bacterium]|nr:excinuclease ABC subunit UvrC [Elusimicrobiota bacterium]